ncbi:hypothetical protein NBRC116592_23370 [Colwellia sp. KU-HH00111]|uniref:hypothetical protein n=1 Tax=Colwellia sp. KU-HH00111 TaxID=3127652 RepID=UPI0031042F00
MKKIILLMFIFCQFPLFYAQAKQTNSTDEAAQHHAWLKQKFGKQHQTLIPKVAVADMLYACNKARQIEPVNYQLKDLVINMDKTRLAEKLVLCLGEDTLQSDVAINFGLLGCFEEQLGHLPEVEQQQKMALVKKAVLSLSRAERQKSLTQCVSQQAIHYLQ